jgi:hypothetical protein
MKNLLYMNKTLKKYKRKTMNLKLYKKTLKTQIRKLDK